MGSNIVSSLLLGDRSQRVVIIQAIDLVDLCGQYFFLARASIH
jgi:hypothetical protein